MIVLALLRVLVRAAALLLIATLSFPLLFACGESEPAPSTASEPPKRTPSSTEPEPDAPERALDTIDVALQLRTDLDEPIVGRSVLLLDSRGRSKERLTDDGGQVHFARVSPPYDLAIAAAPSGVMLVPTIVLGLSRRDPVVDLFERDGSLARPPAETVRVAVAPPPCNAASCFITVATGSATGAGTMSIAYSGLAPKPKVVSVDHEWRAAVLPKDELIDVHVLTGDEGRTSYAYARRTGLTATPGEKRDIGTMTPLPISTTSEVAIASHVALPEVDTTWSRTLMTWLDLPGGGAIALSFVEGKAAQLRLPLLPIPGATVRVEAWGRHPDIETTAPFHWSAHARTGERQITDHPIDVDLMLGPTIARPTLDGRLSRRGLGFEWSSPPGAFLYQLTVSDLGHGRMRFRVFTTGTSLGLGRLETLGLPKLMPGPHIFDLTTVADLMTDDLASPDKRQRTRAHDEEQRAQISYRRLGFDVMP